MTLGLDNQNLESFVPVYDALPDKWEDARAFLVEQLKQISNTVNIRSIGLYLDVELLSGKLFIPGVDVQQNNAPNPFRDVLRIVVDTGALVIGVNPGVPHNVEFNEMFTLIDLWVCGTNSTTLTALRISGNSVTMNSTDLVINSPQAFDRSFAVIEYIQQL